MWKLRGRIAAAGTALMALMVLASACATRHDIYSDYREITRETASLAAPSTTTILILVDGLSVPALQAQLKAGRMPRVRDFFLRGKPSFQIGRAVFPSLTYPNISSILTARDIDAQPIIGNQVLMDGKVRNFESPLRVGLLNRALEPLSVFTRLRGSGAPTASLAQYFGLGATVQYPRDVKSGIAYLSEDYRYIDGKALDSAERLLDGIDPARWPSLMFVHLVGGDALAHERGPLSAPALRALDEIDARLADTFEAIRAAESKGKKVVTILTADHGFTTTPYFSPVAESVHRLAPEVTVINQHRLLTLHFPTGWNDERRAWLLGHVRRLAGVQATVLRARNDLWVHSGASETSGWPDARIRYFPGGCAGSEADYRLTLTPIARGSQPYSLVSRASERCPGDYDVDPQPYRYPFFVSAVAAYFHAPEHADAVVLAGKGVTFTRGSLGQHGGMTPEEMLVPVLMRGASLAETGRIVPTHRLLSFVGKDAGTPERRPSTETLESQEIHPSQESKVVAPPAARSNVRIPQEISLSSPVSRWWLQSKSLDGKEDRTLSSDPTLGLGAEWHLFWSARFSSSVGYQFSFAQVRDTSDERLFRSSANLTQDAFFTGAYHFGQGEKLILRAGLGQRYFPHHQFPGSTAPRLDQEWIPEVGFGSRNRILSMGIGDLYIGGNLAFLVPRKFADYSVLPGFKQTLMASFVRPVGLDSAVATLRLEHETQNTSLEDRSGYAIAVSLGYGLTFAH